MHRKALRDAIDTYNELLRLHQLNEELLQTLELSLLWLLEFSKNHNIPIPDREKFIPLLRKIHALVTEIYAPPFLQHRKSPIRRDFTEDESDKEFTECDFI